MNRLHRNLILFAVCVCVLSVFFTMTVNAENRKEDEKLMATLPGGFIAWDLGLRFIIEDELFHRLPGSWLLESCLFHGAGITSRIGPYVHGSAHNDNLYQIDGIDQRDVQTGMNVFTLSSEVIENVEIQTGSLPAEHGGFMGGLFKAQTRSGSNAWHGSVRLDYVDTSWDEDDEGYWRYRREYDYLKPTLTLGGPVIKDKLWFLGSYSFHTIENDTYTIGSYGSTYYNSRDYISLNRDTEYSSPFIKLTAQPFTNHLFNFSWFTNEIDENNFSGDPDSSTPDAWLDMETSDTTFVFDWTWQISDTMKFNMTAGQYSTKIETLPKKQSNNIQDSPFRDYYWGNSYNNGSTWEEDSRENTQVNGDLSWDINDFAGDHSFKAGFCYKTQTCELTRRIPGGYEFFIDPVSHGNYNDSEYYTGTEAERTFLMFPGTLESTADYMALFIQDEWSVSGRLLVNLGLRFEQIEYENDEGINDVPAWSWGNFKASEWINDDGVLETAPMSFENMISPRLRIAWDLTGDDSTIIHGFYGRYYNAFDHQLPNMFQPFTSSNTVDDQEMYIGPEWTDMDRDGIPDEDYFFDENYWQSTGETPEGRFTNLIDPDLDPEFTDEYIIGIQHRFNEKLTVGVNYIHRQTNDLIEDVGLFLDDDGNIVWTYRGGVKDDYSGLDPDKQYDPVAPGRTYDGDYTDHIYYITNADGNDREYDGVEVSLEARDSNWEANLYYTWSEANGSTTESNMGYTGISQFSLSYDTVQASQNLYGELPWSATHQLRFVGSYWFDLTDWYEMSFGVDMFYNSGYHYSIFRRPDYTYNSDDPYNDPDDPSTWYGIPPYRSYSIVPYGSRGSNELPSHYNIDFSWQNRFKMGKWGTVALILDIENLTDNQKVISVDTYYSEYRPDLAGLPTGWADPRSYRLSLRYSF